MGRPAGRHRAHRARSVPRALGLTLVSAIFPGSGFVMGGRAKLGAFVMTLTFGLVGLAALVGLTRREQVLALAVNPEDLLVITGVLVFLGLCWIAIIISSHRLLRPATCGPGSRAFGSAFVGLICFAIATPMAVATQSVMAQRDLVTSVFASEGKSKSATREKVDKKDPWAKTPRLNILLLGADDGAGREGTRTDTVMVASIDTRTGNTALISLSRNWMRMPFPESSPLHDKYPDGFWDPSLGADTEQPEFYLDAMYRNVPARYPGILGESDNEGADVLKVSVGEALGLKIHYYMQVNLEGFRTLIDALGGITVNVNYRVPIGGDYKNMSDPNDTTTSSRARTRRCWAPGRCGSRAGGTVSATRPARSGSAARSRPSWMPPTQPTWSRSTRRSRRPASSCSAPTSRRSCSRRSSSSASR